MTLTKAPIIPEGWNPQPTDEEFNNWCRYVSGKRPRRRKGQKVLKWHLNKLKIA